MLVLFLKRRRSQKELDPLGMTGCHLRAISIMFHKKERKEREARKTA